MNIYDLIAKTKKISAQFPQQYQKHEYFMDMVEEVGELAQAMLIVDKRKTTNDPTKQKSIEDIADALADVLINVFMLAEAYKIDLPQEYSEMLNRLQKRVDNGEFVKHE